MQAAMLQAWQPWLKKIDEVVRRSVYWDAFFGLASAVMSWVAGYITAIHQYGWGADVFAGVGAACVITLVASCAFMAWRYCHQLPKQPISQGRKILKDKFIYAGTSLGCFVPPSFHAIGTDNENLRLFIDEMHYVPSLGPISWTARRRLLLKEVQKVSRDEMIFIQLLSQHEHDGHKVWQWGEGGSPGEVIHTFLERHIKGA